MVSDIFKKKINRLNHLLAAALLFSVSVQSEAANQYSFTDLGLGLAYDINYNGQVVGMNSGVDTGFGIYVYHAMLWDSGTVTDLGTLDGGVFNSSIARAINDHGQIAGSSGVGNATHATLWYANTITDLGTLGGYDSSANDINNNGQIVGRSNDVAERSYATLWSSNTITKLNSLDVANVQPSEAFAINNNGQVVGRSNFRTVVWENSDPINIGSQSQTGTPFSVNDNGQFVGWVATANSISQATFWDGNSISYLDTLNGFNHSEASAINNNGLAVGMSWSAIAGFDAHATLWDDGAAFDINALLDPSTIADGWLLKKANSINEHGWIVGQALDASGQTHAFLLTPVPEPETYAMLMAGLSILVVVSRRKNGQIKP